MVLTYRRERNSSEPDQLCKMKKNLLFMLLAVATLIGCEKEESTVIDEPLPTSPCDLLEVMVITSDSTNVYMATNAEWLFPEFHQQWTVNSTAGEFIMAGSQGAPSYDLHIAYGLEVTDTLEVCVESWFPDYDGDMCGQCQTIAFQGEEWRMQ